MYRQISKVDSFNMNVQCYQNDRMIMISGKCKIRMRASRGVRLGVFFYRLCLALRAYAYECLLLLLRSMKKKKKKCRAHSINAMRIRIAIFRKLNAPRANSVALRR